MDGHNTLNDNIDSSHEDEMKFVVSHYRKGVFAASRDWKELHITSGWFRRHAAAAAVLGGIFLAAAGVVGYRLLSPEEEATPISKPAETRIEASVPSHEETSHRIEFADASLEEVADSIRKIYGVELTGMPVPGSYRLTLSYEGTAEELVSVINDILDTNIAVSSAPAENNLMTR